MLLVFIALNLIFIFRLKHETVDGYRRYFTQIVGYVSNMEINY